jgi:hypothetical protein
MEFIEMIKNWANDPYITHDDYTKCGMCWKEKIRSEVCTKYLDYRNEVNDADLKWILAEVDNRWHETDLYKRVKSMLADGETIERIGELLLLEGIEI